MVTALDSLPPNRERVLYHASPRSALDRAWASSRVAAPRPPASANAFSVPLPLAMHQLP